MRYHLNLCLISFLDCNIHFLSIFVRDHKMVLFEIETLALMFSIDFGFFEEFQSLSFFIIIGVRFLRLVDIYFLQISYLRPGIKSFYDSPRRKILDFENEWSKLFQKITFRQKEM